LTQQGDYCYHQDAIIAGRPGRVNEVVFSGGFGCIVGPEAMDSWFAFNKQLGKRMTLAVEATNGIAKEQLMIQVFLANPQSVALLAFCRKGSRVFCFGDSSCGRDIDQHSR
jgi:hypothetical protein